MTEILDVASLGLKYLNVGNLSDLSPPPQYCLNLTMNQSGKNFVPWAANGAAAEPGPAWPSVPVAGSAGAGASACLPTFVLFPDKFRRQRDDVPPLVR